MFHLQKLLLPLHRSAFPIYLSLQRALLTSSTPDNFSATRDYLVTTCGLTREQAAKAAGAGYISHCRIPSGADAVVSFLTGPALGLSKADIALLVSKDPRILNSSVDKTLGTRVDRFRSHGFSAAQIRAFILHAPVVFRSFNIDEKLGFWMPLLGSPEKFLRIVRRNFYIVTSDLDRVVKTNIRLLEECGLSAEDVIKICSQAPRLLTSKPNSVRAILARVDGLGVPRSSPSFRHAVGTLSSISQETMASKLKTLGKTLRWSLEEVNLVVSKAPRILVASKERLRRNAEFLLNVVGLPPQYIASRWVLLMYSLERRMLPRHVVLKALKDKGLVEQNRCFFNVVAVTEEKFFEKFVAPYQDSIPGLADAYKSAYAGKLLVGFQH